MAGHVDSGSGFTPKKEDFQDSRSFEKILNFRDVGATVNRFLGEQKVAEGKLFRSARPDDATLADRRRLREDYGIKTIIDLRTVTEHTNQVKKRKADLSDAALIQSNAALAQPVQIPEVKYVEININGKGFERSLLWRLSFWSLIRLITLMLFGYRMEAISILGREVMQPRGLVGLGFDSIDFCGPEIAETLRSYANPSNYPILIHCTQGKDRTGLIVALILFLLSVPIKAVDYEYRLSESALEPEREIRLAEIRSIGLTDDFAACPIGWIQEVERHLTEKYGGVRDYCKTIGFSKEDKDMLIGILKGD